jgi:predicted TIM-barrel fold metal-dependent hydrolase
MHFISEETTAILGLLDSTVFTDFPSLKIVVSHGGGGVPYQIGRFEAASVNKTKGKGPLFSEKLKKLTFDTCLYSKNAIELLIKEVGIDNVVMGSECPGTGTAICPHDGHQYDDVAAYIRAIDWLSPEDKDKVFFKNAVTLFKLGAVKPRLASAAAKAPA